MDLPDRVLDLLRRKAICYVATSMPDGSPQLTQVWADTDGTNVVINTVHGFQKLRNMERDPRVAVALSDPDDPTSYVQIRGHVVEMTEEGGVESIEALSQKYLGGPYPWFGDHVRRRVVVRIAADRVSSPQGWPRRRC